MSVQVPVIAGDVGALEGHAAAISAGSAGMAETGAAVRASWQGLGQYYRAPEAGALLAAMEPVRDVTAAVGEAGAAVARALTVYAAEVAAFQRRLDALRLEAGDVAALRGSNDPDADAHRVAESARIQAEVDRIMAAYLVAQQECAAAIRAVTPGPPAGAAVLAGIVGAVAGRLPWGAGRVPPPADGSPAANARWWSQLGDPERRRIVAEQPELVGNRDGIPAADRDVANRALLARRSGELDAEIAATRGALDGLTTPAAAFTPLPSLIAAAVLRRRLDGLEARRATHQAVADTAAAPDRRLLLLDLDRGHPRAAVAVGDIDTADHVAVFTPGFTSTVTDSLASYDREIAGLRLTALEQLQRDQRGDETVAAVTWIGYDAPQWIDTPNPGAAVYSPIPAATGGAALARLLDGIDASRIDDPHLTAVGHSYGSTTTGYALQSASGVDDAVLYGSPGISTSAVGDLHVPAGQVAVLEADDDHIADAGWFGADPNQLDGVVGLSVRDAVAPDGRPLAGVTGHVEYLTPGTTSQYNIAATIAGLDDQRVEGPSVDEGDVAREVVRRWPF